MAYTSSMGRVHKYFFAFEDGDGAGESHLYGCGAMGHNVEARDMSWHGPMCDSHTLL